MSLEEYLYSPLTRIAIILILVGSLAFGGLVAVAAILLLAQYLRWIVSYGRRAAH